MSEPELEAHTCLSISEWITCDTVPQWDGYSAIKRKEVLTHAGKMMS